MRVLMPGNWGGVIYTPPIAGHRHGDARLLDALGVPANRSVQRREERRERREERGGRREERGERGERIEERGERRE